MDTYIPVPDDSLMLVIKATAIDLPTTDTTDLANGVLLVHLSMQSS